MQRPFCALLLFAVLGAQASFPLWAEEVTPVRQSLLEKATQIGGHPLLTRVAKVVFPQGYKTPLHTHEGPGPRYVIKGQVKIVEGGQSHVYGPGEVFWETGQWMMAENVGEGEAEILVIELSAPRQ